MNYLGESFAFVTALSWVGSSILYEHATKKISGAALNLLKLFFSLLLVFFMSTYVQGNSVLFHIEAKSRIFLTISGIIGLFIGDYFLFRAYNLIGARVTLIFGTLTPIIVSLLGFLFLNESLNMNQLFAIAIICVGIALVVIKNDSSRKDSEKPKLCTKGLVYGIIAILMDSLGIVFTKIGSQGYDPYSVTETRIIPAFICFIIYITLRGEWSVVKEAIFNKKVLSTIFCATIISTAGICSLILAMKHTKIGIVSTISSTSPILILPISYFFFKEKITMRDTIGAFLSCIGVSLLFI